MKALIWVNFVGFTMAEAVTLETGEKSPSFDALDSKGERHNLEEILQSGQKVILYFYPRDSTLAALYRHVILEMTWRG